MRTRIPPAQLRALSAIRRFLLAHERLPTVTELAASLGVSQQTVTVSLNRLARRGLVHRWPGGYSLAANRTT